MAVLVNQSGGQFDLQRLFFQQVDHRSLGDRQIAHQFGCDLPHGAPGFDFVLIGVGVFDQRWRYPDFPQQLLLCACAQLRRRIADLLDQFTQ